MGYYEQKAPPVRDDRLELTTAFGGCVESLLKGSKGGCTAGCARRFSQANACQLLLTLQMAFTVPEAVTVVHGPAGCGSQSNAAEFAIRTAAAARGVKRDRFIWLSTNLQNDDIVAGGRDKLAEAIRYADRTFAPRVIFVALTCAPAVIGDDIDEISADLQREVAARVVPLHCPGFKSRVVASAYDTFYHAIIRHFELEPRPGADYRLPFEYAPDHDLKEWQFQRERSNTVNLINASSYGAPDEKEIVRLLNALDLEVRVYTEYAHYDDFRKITMAALNISLCNVHDDYLATYLEEKYGMPSLVSGMPLGIAATGEWLLAVAGRFGKEGLARRIIAAEEAQLSDALLPLRGRLAGRRAVINGGVIRVAYIAIMLQELGLEVVGLRPYHYDSLSDPVYEKLREHFPDVDVNVAASQMFEYMNILKRERPDLCVSHGGSNAWAMKAGIATAPLFSPNQASLGYAGVYAQARHFAKVLANTALQRNIAENVRLPYRSEWYEKDPYSYITGQI
ncbi:MAG: nitrogenase component 1 [Clostridiales Family XIII bacterium]|jgi:nitrogenase molybdenum-iron protein alpha chain|nr:nitrogenase component 1 [Clostridiales Family XIII bacterium]